MKSQEMKPIFNHPGHKYYSYINCLHSMTIKIIVEVEFQILIGIHSINGAYCRLARIWMLITQEEDQYICTDQ